MDDRNLVDNTDLINTEETDEILRKYDKDQYPNIAGLF